MMTLTEYLPSKSSLSHVITHITTLLQSRHPSKLYMSTPQLFASSKAGFSPRYWKDYPNNIYRCFLYMGRQYNPTSNNKIGNIEEEDCAFVTVGENLCMDVRHNSSQYRIVTFRGLYNERGRKFRMSLGI